MKSSGTAIAAFAALNLAAGCGGASKLSASETAAWLMHHQVAPGVHVSCRAGRDTWSRWDYACTMTGQEPSASGLQNTYGYNVDDHGVTGFSG
jgi:hypothetical protein